MRAPRAFSAVVVIAISVSGCMRSFPPPHAITVAQQPPVTAAPARSELDSMAYGRGLPPVATAPVAPAPVVAVAPPPPPPPPVTSRMPMRPFPPPTVSMAAPPVAAPAPVAVAAPMAVAAPPPVAVAAPGPYVAPVAMIDDRYRLDAGDKLRVVVFGQEGLTNSYAVDAGGAITMPLIGPVQARGLTPAELSRSIAAKLRNGFIREPSVACEVEAYRPFFILGEVAAPGQYPYVPNMTVESAVAIAGGYSPRALRNSVKMTRSNVAGSVSAVVPPTTLVSPGDTIVVGERWF